jgi:hypothetical protein
MSDVGNLPSLEKAKRLGPIQSLLVIGVAFVVLAWLFLMLVGVKPRSGGR